ncbi:hypothetical protein [Aestuariimicrobium sp. T2.26MG-19.2B]|uniref:hypothetical protein n=1 Tax=Aestuariimicrobium sp. T2.26MG-19.2B TaxID=3040679 RepID=UPI0024778EC8|nr:hypothetical protein [Aestuariimicrobium sp. T2.26MG-19.2B]CAI9409740.1 hypothetical protein AESSP_02295 [Aestuariimicrobium sp. T2.26MG-19.2B]
MTAAADLTPEAVRALLADTEPYLSCDECFARIDEYVERRVSDRGFRDDRLETHLAGCGVCAEEAAALEELLRG